jgi:aminoglycoside phosphotransferase (APT) family kinase protein
VSGIEIGGSGGAGDPGGPGAGGAGAQESPKGLDLEVLADYLGTGPLRGELVAGGRSNLTYRVHAGEQDWIVRRPPLGHVLATAHDMSREFRVMAALAPTAVPVPAMVTLCQSPEVVGAPFYVMEFVPGNVYRTAVSAAALGHDRLLRVAGSLTSVLAALHAVDPAEVGLADFGRPDGYLERQLVRWHKQLTASRSREIPGIDELQELLADRLPKNPKSGIVHGDYRLDNTILDDGDRVAAVLDWEMATLGDPLTDLGAMLMYWEMMTSGQGLFGPVPDGARFPSADTLVEGYARATGEDVADLSWYRAFADYKLAVISEGIHFRFLAGQTVGEGFSTIGEAVPVLVDRGLAILRGRD